MKEIWKDIEGYEGLYQVSNKGRIKSLQRESTVVRDGTEYKRKLKEKIRMPVNIRGYNYIGLCKDSEVVLHKIAILVGQAFIPNPKNKPQINHKDGDKTNDFVTNLEWATASENTQHAYDNGLIEKRIGEDHPGSVLDEEKVMRIRELYKDKDTSQNDIAEIYDVDRKTIAAVVNRKTWTHI